MVGFFCHLQCHCKEPHRIQHVLNLMQRYTCHLKFTNLFEVTTLVVTSVQPPGLFHGTRSDALQDDPNLWLFLLVLHCKGAVGTGAPCPWLISTIKVLFLLESLQILFWWMGTAHDQFPQHSSENMLKHERIPDFWNGRTFPYLLYKSITTLY